MALTRRTNFRKAMLAPWHPLVDQIWLYTLAWAQHVTGVAVHQSTLVLNHHHTEVTCTKPNLPVFRRILHGETSKALNTLLADQRYDQPRQLWDDRRTHSMRLLDADAQASHMIYSHVNCVAAGLVRTPEDMPGWIFNFGLWKGGVIWVERPKVYFDPNTYPDRLPLRFSPSPLLYSAFGGDLDALVHHMRKLTEDAIRRLHEARKGRPVIGARQVQRIHPWSEPRTRRESGGELVPTFKIGARGIAGRTLNILACIETRRFRFEHGDAQLQRLAGEDVEFPHGTYLMHVQHGVRVAKPRGDEVVLAPGLTLDEFKAQLSESTSARTRDHDRLLGEVRAAFGEEAGELVEDDEISLDVVGEISTSGAVAAPKVDALDNRPARTGVHVRHRFDQVVSEQPSPTNFVSRVVVLRDQRRGRPPHAKSNGPPA